MELKTTPDFDGIAAEAIAYYLTADFGETLTVDEDGGWDIREAGTKSYPEEVVSIPCPGMGNLDSTDFTTDFVEWDIARGAWIATDGRSFGILEAVIFACCEEDDVSDKIADLVDKLKSAYFAQN